MSMFSDTGLSIQRYRSLAQGGGYVADLTSKVDTYIQKVQRIGGYYEATITMRCTMSDVEDWFESGIGDMIVTYDASTAQTVWEGFINKVTVKIGGTSLIRGPLMDIGNRVTAIYAPLDTTQNPPVAGARQALPTVDDSVSVARYGIIEQILSVGNALEDEALQARDTFLATYSMPETSQEVDYNNTQDEVFITLNCLGFWAWANAYYYLQADTSGTITISDKVRSILSYEYNGFLSRDFSQISTTMLMLTQAYEQDYTQAWALLKGMADMGSSDYNLCHMGFYADRRLIYDSVGNEFTYTRRIADRAQRIEYMGGGVVRPWEMLPGRWIVMTDLLPGRGLPLSPSRTDPRVQLIESIEYAAPYQITIAGMHVYTIKQFLAQLGLGGAG